MFRLRRCVLIAALILNCEVASAQEDITSANWIMPACRDYIMDNPRLDNPYRVGLCAGIITTIVYFGRNHFGICFPWRANVGQAARVVVQYIDGRPARMHERFDELAIEALKSGWPCKP